MPPWQPTLFLLSRDEGVCRFYLRRLRLHRKAFFEVLHIGAPAGIAGSLFSLSGVLISSAVIRVNDVLVPVGSAYDAVIKGSAASANLENFAYAVTQAIYHSSMTFTSRHVGAGKFRRVRRVMLSSNLVMLLLSVYDVMPCATDPLSQLAYDSACERMMIMMLTTPALGFMEVVLGAMRGLGKSFSSMMTSLIGSVLVRALWLWFVFPHLTPRLLSIFVSYPITWLPTGIVALAFALAEISRQLKQKAAQQQKEQEKCLTH